MSTGRHHSDDPHANAGTNTHHGRDAGRGAEPGPDTGVVVAFTPRGEAALEELADSLTADLIASLPDDPASLDEAPVPAIEALLGPVMSADVEDPGRRADRRRRRPQPWQQPAPRRPCRRVGLGLGAGVGDREGRNGPPG